MLPDNNFYRNTTNCKLEQNLYLLDILGTTAMTVRFLKIIFIEKFVKPGIILTWY